MSILKKQFLLFAIVYVLCGVAYAAYGEIAHPQSDICTFCWPGVTVWLPLTMISWPLMIFFSLVTGLTQANFRILIEGAVQLVLAVIIFWLLRRYFRKH